MIDLDELEALEKAATRGWTYHYGFNNAGCPTGFVDFDYPKGKMEFLADDAALIAAARNALPALLKEVRAARAWLEAVTDSQHENGAQDIEEAFRAYRAIVEENS